MIKIIKRISNHDKSPYNTSISGEQRHGKEKAFEF